MTQIMFGSWNLAIGYYLMIGVWSLVIRNYLMR